MRSTGAGMDRPGGSIPAGQTSLSAASARVLADWSAALLGALIYIGDRNGLFAALSEAGPISVGALALRTGQSARYLAEWLSALACAGYLTYDPDVEVFSLEPGCAASLVSWDTDLFLGGLFQMLPTLYGNAPRVASAFGWGTGVPQREYGQEFWEGYERFAGTLFGAHVVQDWIPALDGVAEKLRAGCRVAEVGCGSGQALLLLAATYPDSQFVGYDLSALQLDRAQSRARDAGLEGHVSFELCDVSEGITGDYDLVCAFDVIHGMVDPLGALVAIREALAPGGVLLWSELPLADDLTENLAHPLARFAYGMSVLYCMTTSLAEGGAGLGTCLGPQRVERLAKKAGFQTIRRLPSEHPFAALYDVRP